MQRKIFGPKRRGVAGSRRKLRHEELYNLGFSPNTIVVIRSRRIRWVEHLERMGEMENTYTILVEKLLREGFETVN